MSSLVDMLRGGDRRSIGRVPEVVELAAGKPPLVEQLVQALSDQDAVVRMRAADALEKLSTDDPWILEVHKDRLMEVASVSRQQEVRWHMAQILPRLPLDAEARFVLMDLFLEYLRDDSRIVQTFALQALADLVDLEPDMRAEVREVVERAAESAVPSLSARARKLLAQWRPAS